MTYLMRKFNSFGNSYIVCFQLVTHTHTHIYIYIYHSAFIMFVSMRTSSCVIESATLFRTSPRVFISFLCALWHNLDKCTRGHWRPSPIIPRGQHLSKKEFDGSMPKSTLALVGSGLHPILKWSNLDE